MLIGEVINKPEFRTNKDGDKIVVMVDCQIQAIGDLRPVEMRFSGGEYTIPQIHDDIFIDDSNLQWLIGYTDSDINDVLSTLKPGDKMFYSKSKELDEPETESTPEKIFQSIRQAWMKFFADGEIEAQATDGDLKIPKLLGNWIMKKTGGFEMNSTDINGVLKATVKLKPDGDLELNGTGDFAVRYNELKTAYNQLKSDHDAQIAIFNAHIHATTATVGLSPVGVISPTTTPGSNSTGDIAPAKVDDVRLSV